MASIQKKGESWHLQFRYRGDRRTWVIGRVEEIEARATKAKAEYLLMRIKQHLIHVPNGCDIVTFLQWEGKPPEGILGSREDATLAHLTERYLQTHKESLEVASWRLFRRYLANLVETCGAGFAAGGLTLQDAQRHITRRQGHASRVTLQKEIASLRTVYRWGHRMGIIASGFPEGRLVYPKGQEPEPWVCLEEAERRAGLGVDTDSLSRCVYLTVDEAREFLAFLLAHGQPSWLHAACLFAVHTGARRGEIARVEPSDVDLTSRVVRVRERKRIPGMFSVRVVPLSKPLTEALAPWLKGRRFCFGKGHKRVSVGMLSKHMSCALRGSRWGPYVAWHTLRHSFISALASQGVDQRVIDSFVGHQTETQRRRYRHLYPSTQRNAIDRVWGGDPSPCTS